MSQFLPIEQYLPHRGAMRLLDDLLDADDDHAVAAVRIRHDTPFLENGVLPTWVIVEYMAQTIAAWAGFQARQRAQPVKIGFLLGTRRFDAMRPALTPGAHLRIEARCEFKTDAGLGMFSCTAWEEDTLIAQAQLSVFEPEDGTAFVQSKQ